MALTIPTINETRDSIISDIETKLGKTIPVLPRTVFRILAWCLAGVFAILYKYGAQAFMERFPQTATDYFLSLLGELKNVIRLAATQWEGEAEITATGSSGTITSDTQFIKTDTGEIYVPVIDVPITPGTLTLSLISLNAGDITSLNISDTIEIVSPIAGLSTTASVTVSSVSGSDQEDIEVYRQRVIDAYQKTPQGGSEVDYNLWGREAPNVLSIYPYTTIPGQVDIYAEVDNQPDGIPTGAQLTEIEQYIQFDPETGLRTRRPVTAVINMYPITRHEFDIEVINLSPDTYDIRYAIDNALDDVMAGKEPYIEGLTITRNDSITEAEVNSVVYTTASALGATIYGVVLSDNTGDIAIYVLDMGEEAKIGTVSYT